MKVIIPSTAQSYVFLSALWFDWSVDDYNQTLQRSSSSRSGIAQFIWSHLYLYSLGGIWRIVSGSLCILVKCLIIAHSGRTDLVHSCTHSSGPAEGEWERLWFPVDRNAAAAAMIRPNDNLRPCYALTRWIWFTYTFPLFDIRLVHFILVDSGLSKSHNKRPNWYVLLAEGRNFRIYLYISTFPLFIHMHRPHFDGESGAGSWRHSQHNRENKHNNI